MPATKALISPWIHSVPAPGVSGIAALLAGLLLLATVSPIHAAYELPPTLKAADLFPPDWLRGTHFYIAPSVPTDGFLTQVTIHSDYGTFKTQGPGILGVRLREIDALSELDRLEHGGEFVSGVTDSAGNTGENLRQLAEKPGTTISGIPKAIQRFFKRSYRSAKTAMQREREEQDGKTPGMPSEAGPGAKLPGSTPGEASSDDDPRTVAAGALGFDDARRELAKRLGVDPYTTNAVLARRLDEVAWSAFAGQLSVRVATMFVPGGFIVSTSSQLTDLVWDSPPGDLQLKIERTLSDMGVDQDSIDRLLRHRWYSPSMQAALALALEQLDGVSGRVDVMPLALSVTSEAQARFVIQALLMSGRAHRMLKPLSRIKVAWTLMATANDGELLVTAPVDYLSWNPRMEAFVQQQASTAHRRTLHVAGVVTAYSRLKLEQNGWEVVENSSLFVPVLGYREASPSPTGRERKHN